MSERSYNRSPSELRPIEKTQARVGRRDQESVVQAHADVARRGMHVTAVEQALADAADFIASFAFRHGSTVNALVKKSCAPKLPDLSARCKPVAQESVAPSCVGGLGWAPDPRPGRSRPNFPEREGVVA